MQTTLADESKDEMTRLRNKYRLSKKDMIWLNNMKKEKVICPKCLYVGTLFDFKTFKIGKNKVSTKLGKCPDCMEGSYIKTLRMVSRFSMWEFANYFWENFYLWKYWLRSSIPKVKKRLKHFSYKNRQIFWSVWNEWKNGGRPLWRKEDLEAQEKAKEREAEYLRKMGGE